MQRTASTLAAALLSLWALAGINQQQQQQQQHQPAAAAAPAAASAMGDFRTLSRYPGP